jgi:hypothetical protein
VRIGLLFILTDIRCAIADATFPLAAQGVAAPPNFPYAELLQLANELDHDEYEEPPHLPPSLKRSAEEAFSEDDESKYTLTSLLVMD